jgi:hypothetical protein
MWDTQAAASLIGAVLSLVFGELNAAEGDSGRTVWDAQAQSFLVGAVLILVYQASRFGELNRADPNSGRYMALVPEARARDLADPHAYNLALAVFLTTSFIAYFLICQLSPDVLAGAAKLFAGDFDVKKAMRGAPYPLYVAALFMGLTQPIFPGLSRIKDAQRNFFHEQIAVPGRVVDLFTSLTEAIEDRARGDKRLLADEVRKLASNGFLKTLSSQGDAAFYKAQLDKLGIGNGALEMVLRASSTKELHVLIEQLVMHALIAVMRRSGAKAMAELAKSLGAQIPAQKDSGLKDVLARLVAVGVPFSIGLLTIAFVLLWLGRPVNYLFSRGASVTLWPSTLDYVFAELEAIVPSIIVCMVIAMFVLVPRRSPKADAVTLSHSGLTNLLDFFQTNASVFGLCMMSAIIIKVGQMFREYGTFLENGGTHSASFLVLPVIQSFIALAACLVTTWYLVSWARGTSSRRSLIIGALLGIVGIGFVAMLYDLAFLDAYLPLHPKYGPGWEHLVFSVVANVMVTLCAFASVTIFFTAQREKHTRITSEDVAVVAS